MFSLDTHLKFFTDPLADTMTRGDRIYVNLERVERNVSVGKIIEAPKFLRSDGRMWRVSTDGYHVSGPVVNNADSEWNAWHIGLVNGMDGVAVLGRYQGTHGALGNLTNVRYSDQRALPVLESSTHSLLVDTWFKAASWALELFPAHADDNATVTAKLELAGQRWKHRLARITLLAEGSHRGYEQLEGLIEEGDLPEPTFGAVFNGDILIPSGRAPEREQRTVGAQERIDHIRERTSAIAEPRTAYVAMSAEVPLRSHSVEGLDGVKKMASHTVTNAVRDIAGDYDLQVANYTLLPVLRSAS